MKNFTILPLFAATLFRKIPNIFRNRHKIVFCWLVILQASGITANNLESISKFAPARICEWHFRRFLTAAYWSIKEIICWLSTEVIKSLPKPVDQTIYLTVDGSHKPKRSKLNPYGQVGRIRDNHNYFFGIKFVVLMINWKNFRIPIDFDMVLPKSSANYKNENQIFRDMLSRITIPSWCKQVYVLGDAAFSAKKTLLLLQDMHGQYKKKKISFWYVMAIAKTWKTEDGHFIKDYATHIVRKCFTKRFVSDIHGNKKRIYWCFTKQAELRGVGNVTIVFSKKRRNFGPKLTKVIVTNNLNLTDKQAIEIYQRRFLIEVLFKELKSHIGLGKHQVTKNPDRIKNSFGICFVAYLLLLKTNYKEIPAIGSWSILRLQNKLREDMWYEQMENNFAKKINKLKKAA